MKIKKGDKVQILKGKDKGKSGVVFQSNPKLGLVMVEGLNFYKKHVRPKRQGETGQIVEVSRPIAVSNVALICSSCGKATRVGYKLGTDKKVRICKKCKSPI